jgi:hypothetical protein
MILFLLVESLYHASGNPKQHHRHRLRLGRCRAFRWRLFFIELDRCETQIPGNIVVPLLARVNKHLTLAEDEFSLVGSG